MNDFLRQLLSMMNATAQPDEQQSQQLAQVRQQGQMGPPSPAPTTFYPNESPGQYSARQQASGLDPMSGAQGLQDDVVGNALPSGAASLLRQMIVGIPGEAAAAGAARETVRKGMNLVNTIRANGTKVPDMHEVLRAVVSKLPAGEETAAGAKPGVEVAKKVLELGDQDWDLGALGKVMQILAEKEGK